jgi:DHA1 family bicyclomycin/chloramphenicol resistance-like MFS transporter
MNAPLPKSGEQKHAPLTLGWFVALLASLMAMNALATDIMLPAFPDIGAALDTDVTHVQAVITAYMMGFALSQLFTGFLSDRYGRRTVLLAGVFIYTIASLFTATAGDFNHLLLARFVQGLGSGAPRVIATASVRDCYDGRRMARVMSLTMTVFMAAPVLAPAIGQAILLVSSWRWVMGSIAIYGLATLVICWRVFPETLAVEDRRAISVSAILAAIRSVFANRQTVGYTLAAGAFFGALFGFIGQAQQVMVDVYGLGVWFPLAFAAMALMLSASSFINSRLVERFGMRILSHTAVVTFSATAVLMFVLAHFGLLGFWAFALIHGFNMLLVGLVFSNFNALAMEPQGRIAGVASSFTGAVTVAMGAGIGFLIGREFDGTVAPLAAGFALCGLATLLIILITEKGRLFRPGQGR